MHNVAQLLEKPEGVVRDPLTLLVTAFNELKSDQCSSCKHLAVQAAIL